MTPSQLEAIVLAALPRKQRRNEPPTWMRPAAPTPSSAATWNGSWRLIPRPPISRPDVLSSSLGSPRSIRRGARAPWGLRKQRPAPEDGPSWSRWSRTTTRTKRTSRIPRSTSCSLPTRPARSAAWRHYEVLQVLGKGSFGTGPEGVRREAAPAGRRSKSWRQALAATSPRPQTVSPRGAGRAPRFATRMS